MLSSAGRGTPLPTHLRVWGRRVQDRCRITKFFFNALAGRERATQSTCKPALSCRSGPAAAPAQHTARHIRIKLPNDAEETN